MSRETKTFRRALILPLTEEVLNTHAGLLKIFHYGMLGHACPFENSTSHKQPYSVHSISPAFRTCFKRPLQNRKVTWRCEHNSNNQFFYLTKRKRYLCSKQLKQPFYSLIHSKMIETCYEDTTQTTTFWILAETFYIPSTFCNFNN